MTHGTLLGVWCTECKEELRLSRFSNVRCACGALIVNEVIKGESNLDGWDSADLRPALEQSQRF